MFIDDLEEYLETNGCNFLICNDDIIDSYAKLMVLMYADDTIVMAASAEGLQIATDYMFSFCEKLKLKVNSSKTKELLNSYVMISAAQSN